MAVLSADPKQRKRLAIALGLAAVLYLWLRNRSSQTGITGTTDPTIDPATGIPYAQEGSLAGASGGGADTSGTVDTSALAASLEGITTGLSALSDQFAAQAAQQQSDLAAFFEAQQALNDATSTPAAAPSPYFSAAELAAGHKTLFATTYPRIVLSPANVSAGYRTVTGPRGETILNPGESIVSGLRLTNPGLLAISGPAAAATRRTASSPVPAATTAAVRLTAASVPAARPVLEPAAPQPAGTRLRIS